MLIRVEEAQARLLNDVVPLQGECLPVRDCLDRTLTQDLIALRDQPPFTSSAMDGFAVHSSCLKKLPVTLPCHQVSRAGSDLGLLCRQDEAVRIFTGAPVPEGFDCIIIQENADFNQDKGTVCLNGPVQIGQYIREKGLDFAKGDLLIKKDTLLDWRKLSLAAAMNYHEIEVVQKPRIGVLSSGDELIYPGPNAQDSQIITSNSVGICSLVEKNGGIAIDLGIAKDSLVAIKQKIHDALHQNIDVLVTSGGASVGDFDYMKAAFLDLGVVLDFWKIAMKPGKPLMAGNLGNIKILGLPGNPVSSLICSEIFLKPLIRKLSGRTEFLQTIEAKLLVDLPGNGEREEYLRAQIRYDIDGQRLVDCLVNRQDSAILSAFANCDGLIIRPPFAQKAKKGDYCQVLELD